MNHECRFCVLLSGTAILLSVLCVSACAGRTPRSAVTEYTPTASTFFVRVDRTSAESTVPISVPIDRAAVAIVARVVSADSPSAHDTDSVGSGGGDPKIIAVLQHARVQESSFHASDANGFAESLIDTSVYEILFLNRGRVPMGVQLRKGDSHWEYSLYADDYYSGAYSAFVKQVGSEPLSTRVLDTEFISWGVSMMGDRSTRVFAIPPLPSQLPVYVNDRAMGIGQVVEWDAPFKRVRRKRYLPL